MKVNPFIELICMDGGSILIPRAPSRLPQNLYIQTRESDKVFKIHQYVRWGNTNIYREEEPGQMKGRRGE